MLILTLALSAIILTSGALSPDTPAAEAAQSSASCITDIEVGGNLGPQIPSKTKQVTAESRNCLLGYGNASQAVLALQLAVNYCYNTSTNGIDGIFGNGTKSGVTTVQGKVGVKKDGIYGNNTHNAMRFWGYHDKYGHHCVFDSTKVY